MTRRTISAPLSCDAAVRMTSDLQEIDVGDCTDFALLLLCCPVSLRVQRIPIIGRHRRRDHTPPERLLIPVALFLWMPFIDEEVKAICWRPKQALMECLIKTKCFSEHGEIEPCINANECMLERKNWVLCKVNAHNPRYRLRGNPYDVATDDVKKIEARDERIRRRQMEEAGYSPEEKK